MKTAMHLLLVTALLGAAAWTAQAQSPSSPYRDPDGLSRLVTEKLEPYVLVDVRTPEEYTAGHIPSAVNIPVSDIANQLPTEDRGALVIVYCASGRRSAAARRTLDGLGFTQVVDFGSVSRWKGDLVTGDTPEGDESPEGEDSSNG